MYEFDACRMCIHYALCDKYPLVLLSTDVVRCRVGTFSGFGSKTPSLLFATVTVIGFLSWSRAANYYLSTRLSRV